MSTNSNDNEEDALDSFKEIMTAPTTTLEDIGRTEMMWFNDFGINEPYGH